MKRLVAFTKLQHVALQVTLVTFYVCTSDRHVRWSLTPVKSQHLMQLHMLTNPRLSNRTELPKQWAACDHNVHPGGAGACNLH